MAELSKKETVEQLNGISDLYDKKMQMEDEFASITESEAKAQKAQHLKIADEVSKLASEAEENFKVRTPALSPILLTCKAEEWPDINKSKVVKGAVWGFILWFSVAVFIIDILIGMITGSLTGLMAVAIALIVVAGIVSSKYSTDTEKFADYLDNCKKCHDKFLNTDFDAVDKSFIEECKKIDEDFSVAEKEYTEMLVSKVNELENAKSETNERFYTEKIELLNDINGIDGKLKEYTVLSPDYYDKAADIAKILNTNRADTLKEALNLAIDELRRNEEAQALRKEREEALMRERARIEAESRAAEMLAEKQAKMMEKQLEISRKAAEEQTEILRKQAEDARRAEEQRRREADRRARDERNAAQQAKRAADAQCYACANYSGCRVHGTVGCGAFVPKYKR